ncbi:MAG: transposase [Acidobacteria bacterium]|nr:transposase [Acidobacteriota bacterium]
MVANPRQVRDFAKATGQLARTDALDADGLALFAERVRPTPRPLLDATVHALDAVITRRRQLLDMLTAERNRLEHALGPIRRGLTDHSVARATGRRRRGRQAEYPEGWRAPRPYLRIVPQPR